MHQARHENNTLWIIGWWDGDDVLLYRPAEQCLSSDPEGLSPDAKRWRWNAWRYEFWDLDTTITVTVLADILEALVDAGYCKQSYYKQFVERIATVQTP